MIGILDFWNQSLNEMNGNVFIIYIECDWVSSHRHFPRSACLASFEHNAKTLESHKLKINTNKWLPLIRNACALYSLWYDTWDIWPSCGSQMNLCVRVRKGNMTENYKWKPAQRVRVKRRKNGGSCFNSFLVRSYYFGMWMVEAVASALSKESAFSPCKAFDHLLWLVGSQTLVIYFHIETRIANWNELIRVVLCHRDTRNKEEGGRGYCLKKI